MSEINKVVKVLFDLNLLKQKDAATSAGIPLSTLNKFLNNSTTLNTDQLVRLLNLLGINLCEVLRSTIDKELNPDKASALYDIENVIVNLKYPHQKQNLRKLIQDSLLRKTI